MIPVPLIEMSNITYSTHYYAHPGFILTDSHIFPGPHPTVALFSDLGIGWIEVVGLGEKHMSEGGGAKWER